MNRVFFFLLAFAPVVVNAAEDADIQEVRKNTAILFQQGENYTITRTPVPGLYELEFSDGFMYITKDGKYAVRGEILDIERNISLTEQKISRNRLKVLAAIKENDMLVFVPENGKYAHTINVFTDIDCGYCRKLHNEMAEYLKRGIRVRYMFYPRAGKGSASYKKSVSVWCNKDRHAALTMAKRGQAIEEKTCDNPVDRHMKVADKLSVTGTPTIITEDGSRLPGYVPADRLLPTLEHQKRLSGNAQK